MILFSSLEFLKSAAAFPHFPPDTGVEIAFVGRSNAGKSSAINAIVGKKIARTGKVPGQTQLANFFEFPDRNERLVDLPGYGYAKIPDAIRQRIEHLLQDYLTMRSCLKGLILLMDIRHPISSTDRQLLELACDAHRPVHILLTKSDKISRGQAQQTLLQVRKATEAYSKVSVQTFSALKWLGLEEAQNKLEAWLTD